MICNNVILKVKDPSDVDEVKALLAEQGRLSRQEPGCLRFEVYHSKKDPQLFLLVERWESDEALDAHRQAKAYQEIYKPKVLPKVERDSHACELVE